MVGKRAVLLTGKWFSRKGRKRKGRKYKEREFYLGPVKETEREKQRQKQRQIYP